MIINVETVSKEPFRLWRLIAHGYIEIYLHVINKIHIELLYKQKKGEFYKISQQK